MLNLCALIDIRVIIRTLDDRGAVSVFMLPPTARALLLAEAQECTYTPQPAVVGPHGVRQELSSCDVFRRRSLFYQLRDTFQGILTAALTTIPHDDHPFDAPLAFNDLVLQRYAPGPLGISPHRDGKSFVNLVAIFPLCGKAGFCLCRDREGNDAVELDSRPGTVILLRAPGFRGATADDRPFHFVADITEERISFTLRQKTPPG